MTVMRGMLRVALEETMMGISNWAQVVRSEMSPLAASNLLTRFVARLAEISLSRRVTNGGRHTVDARSRCKLRQVALANSSCCKALAMVLLSMGNCAAADDQQSSWARSEELKKVGYVELSGMDAVHFLVGNSVLVKKSGPIDAEKNGIEIQEQIYYFPNDRVVYECGVGKEADCTVRSWGVQNDRICLDPGLCEHPPKIMKSPRDTRTATDGDRLGVYLWFDHFAYDIVRGNRADGPRFDRQISGKPIELDRVNFGREIEEASRFSGGDEQIPIVGQRAISLLIGNTFLSDDAAQYVKDRATDVCPKQGTYYSPDGRIIHFTCDGSGHVWSISVSHWKVEAGQLCRDGPMEIGAFGCDRATVTAAFAPSDTGAQDKLLVRDAESGLALTGYAGNALNFKFAILPQFETSKEK